MGRAKLKSIDITLDAASFFVSWRAYHSPKTVQSQKNIITDKYNNKIVTCKVVTSKRFITTKARYLSHFEVFV